LNGAHSVFQFTTFFFYFVTFNLHHLFPTQPDLHLWFYYFLSVDPTAD
jgi:hypothetical protein